MIKGTVFLLLLIVFPVFGETPVYIYMRPVDISKYKFHEQNLNGWRVFGIGADAYFTNYNGLGLYFQSNAAAFSSDVYGNEHEAVKLNLNSVEVSSVSSFPLSDYISLVVRLGVANVFYNLSLKNYKTMEKFSGNGSVFGCFMDMGFDLNIKENIRFGFLGRYFYTYPVDLDFDSEDLNLKAFRIGANLGYVF